MASPPTINYPHTNYGYQFLSTMPAMVANSCTFASFAPGCSDPLSISLMAAKVITDSIITYASAKNTNKENLRIAVAHIISNSQDIPATVYKQWREQEKVQERQYLKHAKHITTAVIACAGLVFGASNYSLYLGVNLLFTGLYSICEYIDLPQPLTKLIWSFLAVGQNTALFAIFAPQTQNATLFVLFGIDLFTSEVVLKHFTKNSTITNCLNSLAKIIFSVVYVTNPASSAAIIAIELSYLAFMCAGRLSESVLSLTSMKAQEQNKQISTNELKDIENSFLKREIQKDAKKSA